MENGYKNWVWQAFTQYNEVLIRVPIYMVVGDERNVSLLAFTGNKTVLPLQSNN